MMVSPSHSHDPNYQHVPSQLWTTEDGAPPVTRDVLTQLAHFFDLLGYTHTFSALLKEAEENGISVDIAEWERGLSTTSVPLLELWEEWRKNNSDFPTLPSSDDSQGDDVGDDTESEDDSDSDGDSSEDEVDSSDDGRSVEHERIAGAEQVAGMSGDSSDEDSEDGSNESVTKISTKRKRVLTPDTSASSEDDDDDSEHEDDNGYDSDDDSSSENSDVRPAKRAKVDIIDGSGEEDHEDDSSSASSLNSKDMAVGAGIPLPASDSDSHQEDQSGSVDEDDSDSDSESESESDSDSDSASDSVANPDSDGDSEDIEDQSVSTPPSPSPERPISHSPNLNVSTGLADSSEGRNGDGSTASSATLSPLTLPPQKKKASEKAHTQSRGENAKAGDSRQNPNEELVIAANDDDDHGDMHPDRVKRMPATEENVKKLKKDHVPFSRIPTDTKVDQRFASNDYVPYDYANRAYEDLSRTKGKGFTKEKNKKKRGAYRGGAIDMTPKGIKFED